MTKNNKSFFAWCIVATAAGMVVAWIDSRPNWDDTGITIFLTFLVAAVFGYITSQKPWIIALAVSIWIPLCGIFLTHHFEGLVALIPGFAGAYLGFYIKRKSGNNEKK